MHLLTSSVSSPPSGGRIYSESWIKERERIEGRKIRRQRKRENQGERVVAKEQSQFITAHFIIVIPSLLAISTCHLQISLSLSPLSHLSPFFLLKNWTSLNQVERLKLPFSLFMTFHSFLPSVSGRPKNIFVLSPFPSSLSLFLLLLLHVLRERERERASPDRSESCPSFSLISDLFLSHRK